MERRQKMRKLPPLQKKTQERKRGMQRRETVMLPKMTRLKTNHPNSRKVAAPSS
jgi:hypothetical protein